ncbi:ABC transporter permease [Isoptericola variabilis]|uniref:Transport permease protein n=1 Tax=Isoptericola variabilis (strain 225) TaxID=743718 RepID=F6FS26_ISOV2|nr:ABC transporter permease [Isoptericola variabilis]AEG45123.1 ABC-2 type transporter [Isoptericola variabilis 225]TWH32235.1 ABC-2 type transport system permease protein [Isoptericola variabilis J7]
MTSETPDRAARLAAEPLRAAGPRPGFARGTVASLKDLARQRELLDMLIRRELKARYKDSALGFLWSLGRPLAMLAIYYLALGQFLGAARHIPAFAIFIYAGLTAWGFYSEALVSGTGSVVANSGLVKKVYLPREVFPLSSVGSAFFNFMIQVVILLTATLVAGQFPLGARWGYFVLALLVLVTYAVALSLILSAVNVYLRDVQYLVDIFIMIFFWLSPIVYAWSFVRDALGSSGLTAGAQEMLMELYLANPVTLAVIGFQETFWVAGDALPSVPDLAARLGVALGVGLLLLWLAQRVFARLQSNFAQEL